MAATTEYMATCTAAYADQFQAGYGTGLGSRSWIVCQADWRGTGQQVPLVAWRRLRASSERHCTLLTDQRPGRAKSSTGVLAAGGSRNPFVGRAHAGLARDIPRNNAYSASTFDLKASFPLGGTYVQCTRL